MLPFMCKVSFRCGALFWYPRAIGSDGVVPANMLQRVRGKRVEFFINLIYFQYNFYLVFNSIKFLLTFSIQ